MELNQRLMSNGRMIRTVNKFIQGIRKPYPVIAGFLAIAGIMASITLWDADDKSEIAQISSARHQSSVIDNISSFSCFLAS